MVLEFSWLDLTMGFEAYYVARFILSFLLVATIMKPSNRMISKERTEMCNRGVA